MLLFKKGITTTAHMQQQTVKQRQPDVAFTRPTLTMHPVSEAHQFGPIIANDRA